MGSDRPRSAKVVTAAEELRSACAFSDAGVEQRACRWCGGPAGPRARAAASESPYASPSTTRSSPRAARSNRSRSGPATIAGLAQAVHQPEADDRLAAAHQRAGGDLVLLARGDAVGDQAPERRERLQRLLEHAPAGHLEHDVDALAAVGLDQRAGEVLGVDVDRRVGAQLERQRRACPRWRRWRSRARRPCGARAGPRASRRRRPRRGRRRSRPRRSWAEVRYRCHAVRPWISSASAVASSTPSGIGNVVARRRRRTRRSRPCRPAPPRAAPVPSRTPGHLRARDQRQLVAREVGVLARVGVGEVHPRARDADQHLAVARLGHRGVLDQLEHLRPAPLADPDRAHGGGRYPASPA